MKKTFTLSLFIFMVVNLLCAWGAYSQNVPVTLNRQNVQLETVLNEIEGQTNYLFVYNENIGVNRTVSVNAQQKILAETLNDLFRDTDITYAVEGTNIILTKTEARQQPSQSTQRNIGGMVTDQAGQPIAGVTVLVQGTTKGTITSLDGTYTITVDENDKVLLFQFLGMDSQEVVIGSADTYNVSLKEEAFAVERIVVTALGIKRPERALSYNLQEVSSDELNVVKSENFVNQLSGKVAGLEIKSVSGGVGTATRVTLRGARSISQSNNVLYVIDGVPVYNYSGSAVTDQFESEVGSEAMADINPDDIESISALTGAAASALYGWRGANGVILVTTKKGTAGKPRLTYSNQTTFMKPFVMPEFQNKYGNDIGAFESWGAELSTPSTYKPADFFNTGTTVQHSVTFSGGTERSQTYVSVATVNADGIVPNNAYQRYNISMRNTSKFLDDKLTVDIGMNFMHQKDRNLVAQGEYFNPLTGIYLFPRGEEFESIRAFEKFSEGRNIYIQNWDYGNQNLSMQNPYWVINRNIFKHNKKRYVINPSVSYQALDWLSVSLRMRMDNSNTNSTRELYATTDALLAGGESTEKSKGNYRVTATTEEQFYLDGIVQAHKSFGDYTLTGIVGASIEDSRAKNVGIGGTLKQIPNLFHKENLYQPGVFGEDWHEQTQSVFASFEAGWRNAIFLTVTGRNDWSSTLSGMPSMGFFYPSVGASGVISELVTLPDVISFLKVRGSLAIVGGGVPRQLTEKVYEYDPANPQIYVPVKYMPLKKLKPERTRSWEAGLDISFFRNALRLETTFYHTNSFNQTIKVPVSAGTGYESMWIQTGNVLNRGVEVLLNYRNTWGKFRWEPTLTASWNQNKVIDLGHAYDPLDGSLIKYTSFEQSTMGSLQMRLTEKGTLGDMWSLQTLARDINGNVWVNELEQLATEAELMKIGSTMPKWRFGFRNSFSYAGVSLDFLISARTGGQVLSRTQAVMDYYGVSKASADLRDAGGKPVNNGMIDAKTWYQAIGGKQGIYKYYVYDADNIRLQELRVGYTLPSSWFNDKMKMNVAAVASNLWMIYNKAPFDPEATSSTDNYYQGVDYFMQPSLRSFGFSVKFEF